MSQGSAEVCIAGSIGDFEVEASGLQPRRVGLLGDLDDEIIVMSAVAQSGEPLSGELTLGN